MILNDTKTRYRTTNIMSRIMLGASVSCLDVLVSMIYGHDTGVASPGIYGHDTGVASPGICDIKRLGTHIMSLCLWVRPPICNKWTRRRIRKFVWEYQKARDMRICCIENNPNTAGPRMRATIRLRRRLSNMRDIHRPCIQHSPRTGNTGISTPNGLGYQHTHGSPHMT